MTKTTYFRKSTLALAVAAAACQANAETVTEEPVTELEAVVVTSEFQQSLIDRIPVDPQELPFTLNIVDRDLIDQRNYARPIEALTTLPNIIRTEDRQGAGGAEFLSRGFYAPILVDNRVQNGFRGVGDRDDSFVERYEVLKGPASIASGPVGAGGIINTVTKVPQKKQFSEIKLQTDQFGTAVSEFDVNSGEDVSDKVQVRVSGAYRNYQFDADETQRETSAIRPVATVELTDKTSVKTSVAYTSQNLNPNTGFPLLANGDIPDGIDTDTFTGYHNGNGETEDVLYDAELNHDFLDNLRLTVRGSKQDTDFDYQNTSGLYNYGGGMGVGPGDTDLYGFPNKAEVRSDSTFYDTQLAYQAELWGQAQDFVVGAAYDKRSFERLFNNYTYDGPYSLATIDMPRYGDGGSGPVTNRIAGAVESDSTLNSFFAETAIRPNEKLTIIGGIRYDDLDQVDVSRGVTSTSYDDSEITYRLGATQGITDNLNLYVSYAEAFTPQFGVRRNSGSVDAETSDSVEVGAKGDALGGAVTFQAGYFHTMRENVAVGDPNNGPGEYYVVTIGEVRAQGVEFTSNVKPTAGLNVSVNLGYTDLDVTESGYDEVSEPVVPVVNGSSYLSYELQSGQLRGLTAGGGFRYIGDRNGPNVEWKSYTVADLNFSYPIEENFTVAFDVLNVTDERYVENTTMNTTNKLVGGAVLGAPRTAVFTMRKRF